jgi:hypothetical protein
MPTRKVRDIDDIGLVFAAHNMHVASCGTPPGLRNTKNPARYHGYFENSYGEQFVFTFDRATTSGAVSGGDIGWDEPKSFTLDLLEEVLRETRRLVARVAEDSGTEAVGLPVIDSAFALGRVTGVTGDDEVIWLRACLSACTRFTERFADR